MSYLTSVLVLQGIQFIHSGRLLINIVAWVVLVEVSLPSKDKSRVVADELCVRTEITVDLGRGCGNLLNPLVAAQNFEYKVSGIWGFSWNKQLTKFMILSIRCRIFWTSRLKVSLVTLVFCLERMCFLLVYWTTLSNFQPSQILGLSLQGAAERCRWIWTFTDLLPRREDARARKSKPPIQALQLTQ